MPLNLSNTFCKFLESYKYYKLFIFVINSAINNYHTLVNFVLIEQKLLY